MRMYKEEEYQLPLSMVSLLAEVAVECPSTMKNILTGVDTSIRFGFMQDAASLGHLEVVRALLEHGVDVDQADLNGWTALHNAVTYECNVDLVDLLLSAGAAKDALDDDGLSPLYVAGRRGNLAAMRTLLAAGADATHRDPFQMSPLDNAAFEGRVEMIGELARHGVDLDATPDATGITALHRAARRNRADSVDALVEAGASIDVEETIGGGVTPLSIAAESLALEAMRALLRHGASVLALPARAPQEGDGAGGVIRRNKSPLHRAASQRGARGSAEAVRLLLEWGADESELDGDGNTPAEVVGDPVPAASFSLADADRVRELLANAPADRAWRRRGLLLLCLARYRAMVMRRGSCGGGGRCSCSGSGRTARSWSAAEMEAAVAMVAAVAASRLGKHKRTLSKAGGRRARSGRGYCGRSGGSRGGVGAGAGYGGRGGRSLENRGGFDGVVAMLLEFEQEGFFRTIVGYL